MRWLVADIGDFSSCIPGSCDDRAGAVARLLQIYRQGECLVPKEPGDPSRNSGLQECESFRKYRAVDCDNRPGRAVLIQPQWEVANASAPIKKASATCRG